VGPDRVALVLGQHEAVTAFSCVDVEMVEPEIGQHFLELAVAVDRADQLLLGQLHHHLVGALLHLRRRSRRLRRLVLIAGPSRLLPFLLTHLKLRDLELLRDLARAHADRGETGEPGADGAVGDAFRLQLLFDVALHADISHRRHVAAARSEANPVEYVDDGFIVRRL
jgi:hypothetical protein